MVLEEEGDGKPIAMVGVKGIEEGEGEAITMVGGPGKVYSGPVMSLKWTSLVILRNHIRTHITNLKKILNMVLDTYIPMPGILVSSVIQGNH